VAAGGEEGGLAASARDQTKTQRDLRGGDDGGGGGGPWTGGERAARSCWLADEDVRGSQEEPGFTSSWRRTGLQASAPRIRVRW